MLLELHVRMFEREIDAHQSPRERARAIVYRAVLDARTGATWMVPTGMTGHVRAFYPRKWLVPNLANV